MLAYLVALCTMFRLGDEPKYLKAMLPERRTALEPYPSVYVMKYSPEVLPEHCKQITTVHAHYHDSSHNQFSLGKMGQQA